MTLGVLLVGGFALVVTEVTRRILSVADTAAPTVAAPYEATLDLPAGARIESVAATNSRLILLVRLAGNEARLYFIDPASGAVTGTLTSSGSFTAAPPVDAPVAP